MIDEPTINLKWGPPEDDEELCYGCRFWYWFDAERRSRCGIKGCYQGSKYIEYTIGRVDHE